ncbi:MAG TPA: type II toxin-antitoxin system RelE/ParE family toxin [Terriglobia bacterium]|nr:type II toxin-antitoxin system RelE/ParE family toxin [Terriglobia bacterium]
MRIRWTEPAARDLTHICDYIEGHDAPATARRVALTIHRSVDSLAQFPYRGRPGRSLNTRELVFPDLPLLAVYRVREVVRDTEANGMSALNCIVEVPGPPSP